MEEFSSIKSQIELLNSEVNEILSDNDSLDPNELMNVANDVKDSAESKAIEISNINEKLLSTPIESNGEILQEAIASVNDLKELLRSCRGILDKIYVQIASIDISEPRMIEATASFISSMKDSIQSFIDLYRDEKNFLHGIVLKNIDFEHKKALIKYRHDLEHSSEITDISSSVLYSQEDLMKMINNS